MNVSLRINPWFYVVLIPLFLLSRGTAQTQKTVVHDHGMDAYEQVIRCSTMEQDSISRVLHPERGTLGQFEEYMRPYFNAYRRQQLNGQRAPLITIPVVFHILTDGSGAENISGAIVQAQLDQLNLDFRNLSGSVDPVASDIEIEFCLALTDPSDNLMPEAGIHRVTSYGDGPFSSSYLDATVKPGTIWNPDEYLNIWVADLSSGLLGYAQFPDASGLSGMPASGGAANTDGLVVAYGTVGSVANPGSGSPYNLGRTLTHEAGHWFGLRHIWGDGGCGVDDFCGDTPASDAANYGCPNTTSCGSPDMVENYMDYTDDNCMNLFTADQKTRMRTVMSICPRRASLANSSRCDPPVPTIGFGETADIQVVEGTGCSFTDYNIDVTISTAPSADATVTVTGSGTALNTVDYDIILGTLLFSGGATATQQAIVRVYEDGIEEADESITLLLSVSTAGDAQASSSQASRQMVIQDDDVLVVVPDQNLTILSADFESGADGFSSVALSGSDGYYLGTMATASSAFWSTTGNPGTFAVTNDDACNCNKNNDRLFSPWFSLAGSYSSVTLSFDHAFADVLSDESALVQINTGSGWTTLQSLTNTSVSTGSGAYSTPWQTGVTIDLSAYIGQANVRLRFRYSDGGSWAYGLAIDNVLVQATGSVGIQTALNSGQPQQVVFNGNNSVSFFDPASGNLMCTIENQSAWDYGCTTVEIDRDTTSAGGTTSLFLDTDVVNSLLSKTYSVTPVTNNPGGAYNIKLYYTEAEVLAWENATGKSRSDLNIVKVMGAGIPAITPSNFNAYTFEVSPATVSTFGTHVEIEASFTTGFSGFGVGDPDLSVFPLELISFEGQVDNGSVDLFWVTEDEQDIEEFELERSSDGISYERIHRQPSKGVREPHPRNTYRYLDQHPGSGYHYYRLSHINLDGSVEYHPIVSVFVDLPSAPDLTVYPNPVSSQLTVSYVSPVAGSLRWELYNLLGHQLARVASQKLDEGLNEFPIDVETLPEGVYILHLSQSGIRTQQKFIKK